MKKLLLILLCLPLIGFGQSLNQAISGKIEYTELLTEQDFKEYWKNNSKNIDNVIGLYECVYDGGDPSLNNYVFGVVKDDEIYKFISIGGKWGPFDVKAGGVKMVAKKMSDNTFQMRWRMSIASKRMNGLLKKSGNLLEFNLANTTFHFTKYFSPFEIDNIKIEGDDWAGNGSGFFISREGYIATNYHVIDNANQIEVEFKYNNKVVVYNAEVILSDKQNDLAIIKISDNKYNRIKSIPYSIGYNNADVGLEVFALGFPMALSLMGKEIKFTDGKISSKSGFNGDITSYQIQVPIQPGNSGGPLFDMSGNLIGITSSTINRKLDKTENVNYAIKTNYLMNLINSLDEDLNLSNSSSIKNLKLTDKIKRLSEFVVLIKVR
jgi:S1-C subfamily serine protease